MSNRTRRIWWVIQEGFPGEFKIEPAFERGDRYGLAKKEREEGFPGREIIMRQGVEIRTRGAQTGECPDSYRK